MSNADDASLLLHKHTRREFRQRMRSGELKACIIPVAATEQHLEHLAMEHDWRSVMHISTEVAERLDPRVLVAPAMNIGISEHHMRHPGTLSAMPGSWLGRTCTTPSAACITPASRTSWCSTAMAATSLRAGECGTSFSSGSRSICSFTRIGSSCRKHVRQAASQDGSLPGARQEFETAFALAAFPENVRHDAMADQADKEPLEAHGGSRTDDDRRDRRRSDAARLQAMIDGSNVAPIPPFHP